MKSRIRKIVSGIISFALALAMTVTALPIQPTGVSAAGVDVKIDLNTVNVTGVSGNQGTLDAKALYESSDVTADTVFDFQSSNTDVVTVDSDGSYSLKKEGTATIKVTATSAVALTGGGTKIVKGSKTVSVKVTKPEAVMTVTPADISLKSEETVKITPVIQIGDELCKNAQIEYTSSKESVATVDGNGIVTGGAFGTSIITVVAQFEDNYNNTYTKTATINVNVTNKKPLPTITASKKEIDINLSESNSFNLKSVLTSSEDSIEYDISRSGATVNNSVITFNETGYYTVKATISNESGSASETLVFHVINTGNADNGEISIQGSKNIEMNAVGETAVAEVMVVGYNVTDVIWHSNNTDIVTVTNGALTATGFGTAIVTATIPNGKYVNFIVNVKKSDLQIEPARKIDTIEVVSGKYYDENLTDYIKFTNNNGDLIKDILWKTSNSSIVKVVDGYVMGIKEGIAVVTAYTKDGYSVSFPIKVIGKPELTADVKEYMVDLKDVKNNGNYNIDLASVIKIKNSNSTIEYVSSNTSVLNVDVLGKVTFKNTGLAYVTASADGNSVTFIFHVLDSSKKEPLKIKYAPYVDGSLDMELNETKDILTYVELVQQGAATTPEVNCNNVIWSSNNSNVASVVNGVVKATGEGNTVITATTTDGYYVNFEITVKVKPIKIELNGTFTPITIVSGNCYEKNLGDYVEFTNNNGNSGKDLIWKTSNENVAKVTGGYVIGIEPGTAVITAETKDGYKVSFPVTVIGTPELTASIKEYTVDLKDVNSATGYNIDLSSVLSLKNSTDPISYTSSNSSVLSVDNAGVVKFYKVGIAYVTATVGEQSVTFTFHVIDTTKPNPIKIQYSAGAETEIDMVLGQGPKNLVHYIELVQKGTIGTIQVTNKNVTWSSSDDKVAKVENGQVTPLNGGHVVITATTEDGYYVTFNVNVLIQPTVSFSYNRTEVVEGTPVEVGVKFAPEYASVKYTIVKDGNTAQENEYTLAQNGESITFTPLVDGKFIIKAKVTADGTTFSKEADLVVNSLKDVDKIAFTEQEKTIYAGDSFDLSSLVEWNDGNSEPFNDDITWTSANEDVVTVDKAGIIKAAKAGTTVIYALSYNNKRAKITINVLQPLEDVELSRDSISLWTGEMDNIVAAPVPADADYDKIIYSSDNSNIATIDSNGDIKAISGGTTYVVARIEYTDKEGKISSKTKRVKVMVKAPVKTVEVRVYNTDSPDTIYSKKIGDKIQLKAVITPTNAFDKKIEWSSENNDIAAVDENGLLTTKAKGITYIYAKCLSGGYGMDGNGTPAVGMIKIVVGGDEYSLDITPDRSEVYPGEKISFDTILTPETAIKGKVKWSCDNSSVSFNSKSEAYIAEDAREGLATVTATMELADGSVYTAEALIYIKSPVKKIEFSKNSQNVYIYEDVNLSLIFNSNKTVPTDTNVTWSIQDSSIVSVDKYGKVYGKKLGQTWVYATAYNGKRAEIFVKVISAPKSIALNKHEITCYNGATTDISYSFNPTYTTEKNVTWTTTNSKVAYYDTYTKKIVAVGGGSCYITVSAKDSHFGTVSDKVRVVVKQKTTGITISNTKVKKRAGEIFKLSASVMPVDAYNKSVYWTSSNKNIALVDEFGVVTCRKKGKATITAISADGFVAKCKLTVKKAKFKVKYGVTNVNGLFVRKSPSIQGVQIGQYNSGVSVTIVGKKGEWYKIKYKKGYAYVRSTYITVLSQNNAGIKGANSNAEISATTGIYTGAGVGLNTQAPKGTRVLIVDKVGGYYKIKYGTSAAGTGYVDVSRVKKDSGFKYGKATVSSVKKSKKIVSSTPKVTLSRTAKVIKKTAIYSNATGKGRKLGIVSRKTRLVLNSQKINGYYQVVFTNKVIGYVKAKSIKLCKYKVKNNVNKTNTYLNI